MSGTSDAVDELPDLDETYQLYKDDRLQEFVEAADMLLEQDHCLSRYHTIQLLILVGNCVDDSLDTLKYFRRVEHKYDFWQVCHCHDDIHALQDLAPKLEMLRDVVEQDRMAWEKEQQDAENEEFEASGHSLRDPDRLLDGAADMEEDENESDTNERPAAGDTQPENLVFRPKKKPSKFQAGLRRQSLKSQKSKSELRSLSGRCKKEAEPEHSEESAERVEGLRCGGT